jgi:hypothetical protein
MEKTYSIYDGLTGETIVRPMTEAEIAEYDQGTLEADQRRQAAQDARAAKSALLEKLNITENEAKLLLS